MGMIKKIAVLSLILTSGCSTYNQTQWAPGVTQVGPYDVYFDRMVPDVVTNIVADPANYIVSNVNSAATAALGQTIDDPFILMNRVNTYIAATMGPNNVSSNINKGLAYYRTGLGFLQNPIQTALIQTTPWRK
jgi:hypothetical protein